jgi:tRNA threonylcarbamoyl adenosine modification protein YjeE
LFEQFMRQPTSAVGLVVQSDSPRRTNLIGRAIGQALRRGDTVLLKGELGAGKTHLARGIAEGAECTVPARSPTFVLVNEYPGRLKVSHCDLYRTGGLDEVEELALEERLQSGALVVEWPERAAQLMPEDALLVEIEVDAESELRTMILTAGGQRAAGLASRAAAIFEALEASESR